MGQEVTAEQEQVTDTSDKFRIDVLHPKIFENLLAMLVVVEGCESRLQVVRRCNRRKTTNRARSGASDSSGGRIIFIISMPSRHRLESRSRGNECAASVSTVVYTSALSSVQTYDVRSPESYSILSRLLVLSA